MKNVLITRLIGLLALLISLPIYSDTIIDGLRIPDPSFESGGVYYYIGGDNVSVVPGKIQYSGDIVIPNQVSFNGKTYSVTSIWDYAFQYSSLTSITIPKSLTWIGENAFYGCSHLNSVHFSDLEALLNVVIYELCSMISSPIPLAYHLYVNGQEVKDLVIPKTMTSIGLCCFKGWSFLTSVTIPNSVTSIGSKAFLGCDGLTTITSEIEQPFEIDSYTFDTETYNNAELIVPYGTKALYQTTEGWNKFTKITEAEGEVEVSKFSVNSIYYKVGENNTVSVTSGELKYSGDVLIPEQVTYNGKTYSVTSIGTGAFAECSYLTSVIIPNSVASIGICAFYGCSNLTSVVIPNSVNTIWYDAFHGCSALSSVSIPNSVTSIGEGTFAGCSSLTSIIIPNSVTIINEETFRECSGLKSVSIPNSVTYIGGSAFNGCSSLTSITIPNSVTFIVGSAFWNCSGLTTITSEIEKPFEIDNSTFGDDIYDVAELIVPKGTKALYQATEGWNKFAKITEAAGEEEISEFYVDGIYYKVGENNTVSVTSGEVKYSGDVVIPSQVTYNGNSYTVTSISSVAFMNCTNLTSITIPNSVKSIGSSAFWGCEGLTSVTIPNGVTSIESGVFYHCYGLTSVTIPNSVMSIGDYAFWECSITSLTIPNSVTSIGENAFGDGNLMNPIVSEIMNPFEISENTFDGINYAYSTLIVPSGTKSLYQSTAGWNKFQNIVEDNSDEANFTIDGVTYQGTKSEKMVVVESVDKSMVSLEIPASVRNDGTTYQVTGVADDAFNGCSMATLIWNVEAVLPNNAFSNASIGSNFLLYVKSADYAPSSVKNVVADGTAQTIVLADDGGQFYCPQAFTTRSISYTHNYSMETGGNGKGWETIALPFDVQKISHSTRGEIVPFPAYNSSSNQKPFWLAIFSGSGFRRTAAVLANEPYIIAMPNSTKYQNNYNLAGDVTFSADNVQVPKTPSFSGTFVPAFATVAKSSSVYALNVNNRYVKYSGSYDAGSRFISGLRDVRPFEAYMTSGSSTRGVIEINFDDGTTGIDAILFTADDCQEMTIHSLSGQQVTRTTQCDFWQVWDNLPKGVYIVNGKKKIK